MTRDSVVSETTALVAVSEATPLLQANHEVAKTNPQPNSDDFADNEDIETNHDHDASNDDDKPLPRTQIFLLCYCRMVEPISFFSIFPYVNNMIADTGNIKEEDVGFYSGLIVCINFRPCLCF